MKTVDDDKTFKGKVFSFCVCTIFKEVREGATSFIKIKYEYELLFEIRCSYNVRSILLITM